MPKLSMFRSPADQAETDLARNPTKLAEFKNLWNTYVNGFTQQSILGNPWTATHASHSTNYFNPLDTDVPSSAVVQRIFWNALPGRIAYYNGADWGSRLSQDQMYQLADFGDYLDDAGQKHTFPHITTDPCSGATEDLPYGPYGPRGWQDEYTEWSVIREGERGKVLRIDFTCENPEYWYSLWRISPETVLAIYREILFNPNIQLDELTLKDPTTGQGVIDPSTGHAAYDPLNKWNRGPQRTGTAGGAMHLTSTPNTLQTETGLAGTATIQRTPPTSDPEVLLCCGQFGQAYRNSDPHIGQVTNQVVGAALTVTLADPPGLYIQMPDFSQYELPPNAPPGAKASDYWRVVRGKLELNDQLGRLLPGNLILHAVYEVPPDQGFTVGDIKIAGQNIRYAGQVAATFSVQLNALAFAASVPAAQPCVGDSEAFPQPFQMFFTTLWNAYYGTTVANPVGVPMKLASNTVVVPPILHPGQQGVRLTLTCTGIQLGPQGQLPTVTTGKPTVRVTVLGLTENLEYAVPGNSYPGPVQALSLSVDVDAIFAALGLCGIRLANHGAEAGPEAPAFLLVQAPTGSPS
jgi:hypothetical protein